jgi:hypothetical protein
MEHKSVGNMLGDPVVITEKLDGSNFSVHMNYFVDDDGQDNFMWEFRSRNQKCNTAEGSLFYEAWSITSDASFLDKMREIACNNGRYHSEAVFYFEVIGRGIQKRINYAPYFEDLDVPQMNGRTIALIDIRFVDVGQSYWPTWDFIVDAGYRLGVIVPKFFRIEALNIGHIETLLEEKDIEGYVIRAEDSRQVFYNRFGDLKRVKLKTSWFDGFEKSGPRNKKPKAKTPPEIIDFLVTRINFGRLHSIYSHGHDTLKKEMADMKYLIDLVVEDIKAEDGSLWEQFDAEVIRKTCARMLPRTLQGYLLERNT